jgi:hypothetical protein
MPSGPGKISLRFNCEVLRAVGSSRIADEDVA